MGGGGGGGGGVTFVVFKISNFKNANFASFRPDVIMAFYGKCAFFGTSLLHKNLYSEKKNES